MDQQQRGPGRPQQVGRYAHVSRTSCASEPHDLGNICDDDDPRSHETAQGVQYHRCSPFPIRLDSVNGLAAIDGASSRPPAMQPLLVDGRRTSDITTGCISELRILAVDAEHAGSPRDEAVDAVSARPGEDQPNEDQYVQHLGEVEEAVEPGEDTAHVDAVDPISSDRDDHVSREHCSAHRREQSERQGRPAREFDQRNEQCAGVRKRNVRLNYGLLHLAEPVCHEQLGPAGNTEKDANQDAGGSHRHPFHGTEHSQDALDHMLHVS